jgi:hypothetical protein
MLCIFDANAREIILRQFRNAAAPKNANAADAVRSA